MANSGAPQPGATIVQYAAQTPDGTQQFFVPGSQVVVQGMFCAHFILKYAFLCYFKYILNGCQNNNFGRSEKTFMG